MKSLGRMSPGFFFKNTSDVMLVAFSTSSSNATLPTTLRAAVRKSRAEARRESRADHERHGEQGRTALYGA
jgi:Na+/H+-dicarboxylate symporter